MLQGTIDSLKAQAEEKTRLSAKIIEVFNQLVDFQDSPEFFISKWSLEHYLNRQRPNDYFTVCNTINIFKKLYSAQDRLGNGPIAFPRG